MTIEDAEHKSFVAALYVNRPKHVSDDSSTSPRLASRQAKAERKRRSQYYFISKARRIPAASVVMTAVTGSAVFRVCCSSG